MPRQRSDGKKLTMHDIEMPSGTQHNSAELRESGPVLRSRKAQAPPKNKRKRPDNDFYSFLVVLFHTWEIMSVTV